MRRRSATSAATTTARHPVLLLRLGPLAVQLLPQLPPLLLVHLAWSVAPALRQALPLLLLLILLLLGRQVPPPLHLLLLRRQQGRLLLALPLLLPLLACAPLLAACDAS